MHRTSTLLILLLTLCGVVAQLHSQELTLPVYRLQVDEDDLAMLNNNPWFNRTVPATLEFVGEQYDCQVRYRGASGRNLPKKSWKIYFDAVGPHDETETNLNSEYRDQSFSRNHLAMTLARISGLPAPETRFMSLMVNDVYHGVYIEFEQIDEQFFNARDMNVDALFKCGTAPGYAHSIRFAPPLNYRELTRIYEPKLGAADARDDLGRLLDFIHYSTPETFAEQVEERLAVSDILRYFAVQYCIGNSDGIAKNIYLAQNRDGQYYLLPWDCDASFGNTIDGNYVGNAWAIRLGWLEIQGLFQRLIESPERQGEMLDMVEEIATDGFDSLADSVEGIWNLIRHDVELDTFRLANGDRFDYEEGLILRYMSDRSEALEDLDHFRHVGINTLYTDVEYLSDPADSVTFYAELETEPDEVHLAIVDSSGREFQQRMWDDGSHGDDEAGDLIYSMRLSLDRLDPPYYYCGYAVGQNGEMFPFPPAAWHLFRLYRLSLPSIRVDTLPPEEDDLDITGLYYNRDSDSFYFGLINVAEHPLNLSGCVVRLGSDYRMLRLTELPILEEDDTLYVSNRVEWVTTIIPDINITGELHFVPQIGDTLKVETSSGSLLADKVIEEYLDFDEPVGEIVINEINYHSSDDFNPDDWIELYSRFGDHDLSGWSLCDREMNHRYYFPAGSEILQGGFMIIARDPAAFADLFPDVEPLIGGFDFGFSASGDEVCLLDSNGSVVDRVWYDDSAPWDPEADGQGATLELVNPDLPNFGYEFWEASREPVPHGTPGRDNLNNIGKGSDAPTIAADWQIEALYPLPFNSQLHIRYTVRRHEAVTFTIMDITGRQITTLTHRADRSGQGELTWNGTNRHGDAVASGMYFVGMDGYPASWRRVVLMR